MSDIPERTRAAQRAAQGWNNAWPVGMPVDFTDDDGAAIATRTITVAFPVLRDQGVFAEAQIETPWGAPWVSIRKLTARPDRIS